MLVFCNFLNILMVSDKTIFKAKEFIKLSKQNPLDIFSLFLPKRYIGFKGEVQ